MNKVFDTLYNHRSIRNFKNQTLPQEQKEALLKVVSSIPTSINGQNFSIIVVEDKDKRSAVSNLSNNQPYINTCSLFLVVVMDFYRSYLANKKNHSEQQIHKSLEAVMVGSVDAGIILGSLIVAAESLGLGTVPIGSVRKEPAEICKLLNLPKYTFPVVGLCIGIPDDVSSIKPRLPQEVVVFQDAYNTAVQDKALADYDKTLANFNKETRGLDKNWTSSISEFYSQVYFPKLKQGLQDQGFDLTD